MNGLDRQTDPYANVQLQICSCLLSVIFVSSYNSFFMNLTPTLKIFTCIFNFCFSETVLMLLFFWFCECQICIYAVLKRQPLIFASKFD